MNVLPLRPSDVRCHWGRAVARGSLVCCKVPPRFTHILTHTQEEEEEEEEKAEEAVQEGPLFCRTGSPPTWDRNRTKILGRMLA